MKRWFRTAVGVIGVAGGVGGAGGVDAEASAGSRVEQPGKSGGAGGAIAELGQPKAKKEDHDKLVQPSMVLSVESLVPGTEAEVALVFDIAPGWHLYWDGENDSGMPPEAEWELPEGVSVGALRWPGPERYEADGGLLDSIYEGRVVLLAPVKVDAGVKSGAEVRLKAKLSWMVCKDVCIVQDGAAEVVARVSESGAKAKPAQAELFQNARARLPKAWGTTGKTSWEGTALVWEVAGAQRLTFYPGRGGVPMLDRAGEGRADGGRLKVRFDIDEPGGRVVGLLGVERERSGEAGGKPGEREYFEVNVPAPGPKVGGG